jgi:hypothetical protein
MRNIAPSLAVLALAAGCSGSQDRDREREAAGVAGVAAALEVVRTARAQSPDSSPPAPACCVTCPRCTFPCAGECVPLGTLCASPPGCACSGGGERAPRPEDDEPPCLAPVGPAITP